MPTDSGLSKSSIVPLNLLREYRRAPFIFTYGAFVDADEFTCAVRGYAEIVKRYPEEYTRRPILIIAAYSNSYLEKKQNC